MTILGWGWRTREVGLVQAVLYYIISERIYMLSSYNLYISASAINVVMTSNSTQLEISGCSQTVGKITSLVPNGDRKLRHHPLPFLAWKILACRENIYTEKLTRPTQPLFGPTFSLHPLWRGGKKPSSENTEGLSWMGYPPRIT